MKYQMFTSSSWISSFWHPITGIWEHFIDKTQNIAQIWAFGCFLKLTKIGWFECFCHYFLGLFAARCSKPFGNSAHSLQQTLTQWGLIIPTLLFISLEMFSFINWSVAVSLSATVLFSCSLTGATIF